MLEKHAYRHRKTADLVIPETFRRRVKTRTISILEEFIYIAGLVYKNSQIMRLSRILFAEFALQNDSCLFSLQLLRLAIT